MNAKGRLKSKGQDLAFLMAWIVCGAFPALAQWVPYGPGPRAQHTAVFDPATDQMIVFGGTDLGTTNYNDVWVALNVIGGCTPSCPLQWAFETPSGTAPVARHGHTAVYDSVNSRMIAFGGAEGFPKPCANDLWVLQNANTESGPPSWTELSPGGTPPAPREGQVAAYDPVKNVLIIFGGSDCNGGYLQDVWVTNYANGLGGTGRWKQLTPKGSPPPARAFATAVFNSSTNELVLYGGSNGTELSDVWVLSGANGTTKTSSWSQESPSGTAPSARYGAASGYDSVNDRMIVNSGYTTQGILGDTWVLVNATGAGGSPSWAQLSSSNAGPQNYFQSGAYDATDNEFIDFAGISERAPNPNIADDHIFVLSGANGLTTTIK